MKVQIHVLTKFPTDKNNLLSKMAREGAGGPEEGSLEVARAKDPVMFILEKDDPELLEKLRDFACRKSTFKEDT